MGNASFCLGVVSVSLALAGCAFDSLAESGSGATLGGEDTSGTGADEDSSPVTSNTSASGSASGGTTSTTNDPTTGMSASESDPTSASNTSPTSESESDTTSSSASESMSASMSASATRGTESTGDPTTGDPTTGTAAEPYAPCPNGDECPKTDTCVAVDDAAAGYNVIATWCAELDCGDDDDCPDPSSGNAMPRCRGPNASGDTLCVLDCASDTLTCPDGMECMPLNVGWRCVWEV